MLQTSAIKSWSSRAISSLQKEKIKMTRTRSCTPPFEATDLNQLPSIQLEGYLMDWVESKVEEKWAIRQIRGLCSAKYSSPNSFRRKKSVDEWQAARDQSDI